MSEFRFHPAEIDRRETTSQFTDKLYRLVTCLMIAGAPIAFWSATDPNPQFRWTDCLIAGAFGAIAMARYAYQEEMPLVFGLFAGTISGCGVYAAIVGLLLQLKVFSKLLILLFSVIGALPGLLLFYLLVWIYYSVFDMSELPMQSDSNANDEVQ